MAIYNSLLACPATKVVKVEGMALSAASFVIQAADEIEVAPASFVMIHRAWGMTMGDAEDHFKTAAQLEQHDGVLADIYARRSKRKAAEWRELMTAESWFTGEEAIDAGLADRLIETAEDEGEEAEETEAAAHWDRRILDRFKHAPAALVAAIGPWSPGRQYYDSARALIRHVRVSNEGRVLSARNKERLNSIRDLAQEVIDTATATTAADDEEENRARAKRQAEVLTLMEIETDLALAGMEAL